MQASQTLTPTKPHALGGLFFQNLTNELLKLATEPVLLKKKIERILDLLLSRKELGFAQRAACFLLDGHGGGLRLSVTRGSQDNSFPGCQEINVGTCHCGEAAIKGEIVFCEQRPPLYGSGNDFAGNYCVPIEQGGHILGMIAIYVTAQHRPSLALTMLLEAVSKILAMIIEGQQMDQQLIKLVNDLRRSIIDLREEKKFSESVIQGLNHGLLVTDTKGAVLKCNSVASAILKPFASQVEGQTLSTILGKNASNTLLAPPGLSSGPEERELTLTTPSGEFIIVNFSNVPREDALGQKVGMVISLLDITELKYVRREMEKMNRLSTVAEIASAVAHEVRNPLAGIKIMAQSIEEESGERTEQLECSRRIIRQVDRLNELLNEFFSYARPAEPNKRPTSLREILNETHHLIANRLVKNHIELRQEISPTLPLIIADPHQVQQVFLNLFLNAIDAIRGQGRIDIRANLLPKKRIPLYRKRYPALLAEVDYAMVTFTDNGTGMPPEVADKVFEPFFTTKTTGAGLGMSIVYRTLKENDAAITLQSKEGKGTSFTMFFRVQR